MELLHITQKNVRDYLTKMFGENRVISRGFPQAWPACSPDLNPFNYWFWGTLKARIFHVDRTRTLEKLKNRIIYECSRFTTEEFSVEVRNLLKRLYYLSDVEGNHTNICYNFLKSTNCVLHSYANKNIFRLTFL